MFLENKKNQRTTLINNIFLIFYLILDIQKDNLCIFLRYGSVENLFRHVFEVNFKLFLLYIVYVYR